MRLSVEEKRKKKWKETHKFIDEVDHKKCGICEEYKPCTTEFFYKNKSNGVDGFHTWCKICTVKKSGKWIENNYNDFRKHLAKYQEKDEYKHSNKEAVQRSRDKGNYIKWQRNNKDKLNTYKLERANKEHTISKEEWDKCKLYFNSECAYCGLHLNDHYIKYAGKIKLGDFHKEHFQHFGANDLSNCVPSCKECNSSKGEKSFEYWYPRHPNYTNERHFKITKWLEHDYKLYIKNKDAIN